MTLGKAARSSAVWAAFGRLAAAGSSVTFYDCTAGLDDFEHLWTADQQLWCCQHAQKGCVVYDCRGVTPGDGSHRQVWCCTHMHTGCAFATTTVAPHAPMTSAPATNPPVTHAPENLRPGPHHTGGSPHPPGSGRRPGPDGWHRTTASPTSTSRTRRGDVRRGTGAATASARPASPSTAATTSSTLPFGGTPSRSGAAARSTRPARPGVRQGAFHCHKDHPRTWPEQERQWCCQMHKLGCDVRQEYNCATDQATWDQSWAADKKDWCCVNEGKGCSPFDCQHIGQTHTDSPKQRFCCEHESIGCPYDCNMDLAVWDFAWTEDKRKWCCSHKQVACEAFNCEADPARATMWTPEKRSWCCSKWATPGIGCPTLV